MFLNQDIFTKLLFSIVFVTFNTGMLATAMPIIKSSHKAAAPVNLPTYNIITSTTAKAPSDTVIIPAIPIPTSATPKVLQQPQQKWISQQVNPAVEAEVERIEKTLMARTYPTASLDSRLARLEKLVYGQAQEQKTEQERLAALSKIIPVITPQVPEDPAIVDNNNANQATQPVIQDDVRQQPSSADPQLAAKIDGIEMKIFNRTFANESVESRISRMEKIEFNSTAPDMAYDDRLDRVASVMRAHASSTQEKIGQTSGFPGVTKTQAVSNLTGLPQQITQGRPINSSNPNGPRKVHYGTPGSGMATYGYGPPGTGTGGIMLGRGMGGSVAPQIMMMIFSALTRSAYP